MTVFLKIESCDSCPRRSVKRHYTADSFEDVREWTCTATGQRIALHEWNDKVPPIPSWCPLRAAEQQTKPPHCATCTCHLPTDDAQLIKLLQEVSKR